MTTKKKNVSATFFSDISNCFFGSHKVIHHSHMSDEIHGDAHNFCNKQVRKLTGKRGSIFHASFIMDSGFLK